MVLTIHPSSDKVKERVQLYLYSPFGPVLGRTFPLLSYDYWATMPDSVWGLGYRLDDTWFDSQQEIFHTSRRFKLALGPTQPSIQWLSGPLSLGVKLIPLLHLELRLRMSGAILLLPIYTFVVCRGTTTVPLLSYDWMLYSFRSCMGMCVGFKVCQLNP